MTRFTFLITKTMLKGSGKPFTIAGTLAYDHARRLTDLVASRYRPDSAEFHLKAANGRLLYTTKGTKEENQAA